ncbi:GATOR complex protein wdr59 [Thoreauomyces humboldtii]|nr:GATOR complex protein wdr59 [Thoreauomyces humboldtii]
MRDVTTLLPLNEELARQYTLAGDDPAAICSQNGAAAELAGRPDLAQIWGVAGMLLTMCHAPPRTYSSAGVFDHRTRRTRRRRVPRGGNISENLIMLLPYAAPTEGKPAEGEAGLRPRWQWHPFGRQMVHDIFTHLERCGDVQTLAMLVCVFSDKFGNVVKQTPLPPVQDFNLPLTPALRVERVISAPGQLFRQASQSYFRQQISSTSGNTMASTMTSMVAGMITPPLSAAFSMMGVVVSNVRASPESDTVALQLTSLPKDGAARRGAGWLRGSTASISAEARNYSQHHHHPSWESEPASPGSALGTPGSSYAPDAGLMMHPAERSAGSSAAGALPYEPYPHPHYHQHNSSPATVADLSRNNSTTYAQAAAGVLPSPPPRPTLSLRHQSSQGHSLSTSARPLPRPGLTRQHSHEGWNGNSHATRESSAPPSPKPLSASATVGWTLTAPIASVMAAAPRWAAPATPSIAPASTPGMYTSTVAGTTPSGVVTPSSQASTPPAAPASVLMLRLTEDEDAERPFAAADRRLAALLPSPLAAAGSLLDPAQASRYAAYAHAYAAILYNWGLVVQRAEVLRFLKKTTADESPSQGHAHVGVDFGVVCPACGSTLVPTVPSTLSIASQTGQTGGSTQASYAYCWRCDRKRYGVICAICRLPCRGVSTFCLVCAHGGHADHVAKWFDEEEVCPAGCGCACRKVQGGYRGI